MVSSEIARGLDIYELLPSGLITQNELAERNWLCGLGVLSVPYPEKPIHRPPAPTPNQSTRDTSATSL